MNVDKKLLLSIGLTTLGFFMATVLYIANQSAKETQNFSYQQVKSSAKYHGVAFQRSIRHSLGQLQSLNSVMTSMVLNGQPDRAVVNDALINIIRGNSTQYLGVWTLWEPNAFDGKDHNFDNTKLHDETGRLNTYWYWQDNEIVHENNINWQNAPWYETPKIHKAPVLLNPYPYQVSGEVRELVSLVSPIYINNVFVGSVGIDFNTQEIIRYIENINVLIDSPATLLSNDATFIAGKQTKLISPTAITHIKSGSEHVEIVWDDALQDNIHLIYTPITIAGAELSWSLVFSVPEKTLYAPARKFTQFALWLSLLSVLVTLLITTLIVKKVISKPIARLETAVAKVKAGNYDIAVPVNSSDEISCLSIAFNQMTERLHDSEQKTQQLHNELETKVLERTAKFELANTLLAKEKDKAEQSNRAKTHFLANMSHEIRTPLNGVIGAHHVLKESALTSEQHELVDDSLNSAQSLLTILNDILDFAKIEAQKLTIDEKNVELETTLQQVLNLVALSVANKGINFDVRLSSELPKKVQVDPLRLTQILLNLLSNAIKFTPHGSVLLAVSCTEEQCKSLEFRVIDTGIGISSTQSIQLFEPFEQAELNSTKRFGGAGLGLAISKSLATRMGGELTFSSVLGSGTTFTLRLPCKSCHREKISENRVIKPKITDILVGSTHFKTELQALFKQVEQEFNLVDVNQMATTPSNNKTLFIDKPALLELTPMQIEHINGHYTYIFKLTTAANNVAIVPDRETTQLIETKRISWPLLPQRLIACLNFGLAVPRSSKELPSPDIKQALTQYKILLADDVLMNRKLLDRILQRFGGKADLVNSGLEVLTAMEQKDYDIILMDLHMPGMDGFEATRIIKSRDEFKHVRIIALTADVIASTKQSCYELGMNGFVAKPFAPKALLKTMLGALQETTEAYRF